MLAALPAKPLSTHKRWMGCVRAANRRDLASWSTSRCFAKSTTTDIRNIMQLADANCETPLTEGAPK